MQSTKHFLFLIISFSFLIIASSCDTVRTAPRADRGEVQDQGYGKIKKKHSTSSVSSFEPQNTDTNLTMLDMVMRLPGVQVSGQGVNASVLIRGVGSINSSNEPLFVVDNVPVGTGFDKVAFMNPLDVDRISVLKDAGATGIYGVQGANGVILITTKRAK